MFYLNEPDRIIAVIEMLKLSKILWLDTEIAAWETPSPRLSLIQISTNSEPITSNEVYLLDVLDKPDLIRVFISEIMENRCIEKVFHNARFDLKFLGGKRAANVTCTYQMARGISVKRLGLPNLKLKTLAEQLCHFQEVDKTEQSSDWGKRPLSDRQVEYAAMDVVYLAKVHIKLLSLTQLPPQLRENSSFTVTKVRIALECPRLFYLNHHFSGDTLFLPPDKILGTGKAFHSLAEKFIKLTQSEPKFTELVAADKVDDRRLSTAMQELFYENVFCDYLDECNLPADSILHLWESLKTLTQRWALIIIKNRAYCTADEVFAETFVTQEFKLKQQFDLGNNNLQPIVGKLDSLIYDFERKRLCVVEYKTYQSQDISPQIAQVSVYSWMLQQHLNSPVDAAIYSIFPNSSNRLEETLLSSEELENTIYKSLPSKLKQMQEWADWEANQLNPPPETKQPHLCEICPQQAKCIEILGIPIHLLNKVNQPELSQISTAKSEALGTEIVNIYDSFKIKVEFIGASLAPAFTRIKIKPKRGIKIASLLNLVDELKVHLNLAAYPLISTQAGYISIDIPRSDRQTANFTDYLDAIKSDRPYNITLGIDLEGKLIEADLSDPNTCHFLVAGTTGSGKSEFLRSLLASLLARHSPQELQIILIDPKRVTFTDIQKSPWLYAPIIKEDTAAIELMDRLVKEMERRYQIFEKAASRDLDNYNRTATKNLPRLVCIFDEYADLMVQKDIRTSLEQNIKRLGAKARAAGIHLILATQRPDATVVTPLIRSNLPGRIALKTASEADSKIILGGSSLEAAYLLGKGDLLYQSASNLLRLQGLLVSDNYLLNL